MHKELTTLFTGQNRIQLETVTSTNTYLAEQLKTGFLPEGTVVKAISQTAGRGQAGQEWSSEEGKNLLLSFLFYPAFLEITEIFMLSRTFSLGIFDYLENRSAPALSIKWPNDIYCDQLKICGMLIENSLSSSKIIHTILGIGMNINQKLFPLALPNPVSLRQVLRREFDLEEEFCLLCSSLENRYLQLKRGEYQQIKDDYDQKLFRMGEWHWYSHNEKKFLGKITGVNSHGFLCLEFEDGRQECFELKELVFV